MQLINQNFNFKINLRIESDLFKSTDKIEFLSFSGNRNLSYVASDTFAPINNLTYVFFEDSGCINLKAVTPAEVKSFLETIAKECSSLEQNIPKIDELIKERRAYRAKEKAYQALNSTLQFVNKENVILSTKIEKINKERKAKQEGNSTTFTCIIVVFVVIAVLGIVYAYKDYT